METRPFPRKPHFDRAKPIPALLLTLALVFIFGHYSGRGFAPPTPTSSLHAQRNPSLSSIRDADAAGTRPSSSSSACSKVYIDVGTNVGDSIENFARGRIEAFKMVDIANLTGVPFTPSDFCVFGFEGNPKWTPTLKDKQAHLAPSFRSLNIFTETVADVQSGTATLYLDTVNEARNNWGSSMIEGHRDVQNSGKVGVEVAAVDFAAFLRDHSPPMEGEGGGGGGGFGKRLVIVRMDIEGMEYPILQNIVSMGLLCNTADFFLIEWHWMVVEGAQRADFGKKTEVFRWLLSDPRCHAKLLNH